MRTLHELPVPASGLERGRIISLNRKIRELSASNEAIAHDLFTAIMNNSLALGEKTLDSTILLSKKVEEMTARLKFGRDRQEVQRQRSELRATPLDAKRRWASYFVHRDGGIADLMRNAESAWNALDERTRHRTIKETVANDLRHMEELGLVWGGDGSYGLTVAGLRFVRAYGFPKWLSRYEFWKLIGWWAGIALGAYGVVANTFEVFGCGL